MTSVYVTIIKTPSGEEVHASSSLYAAKRVVWSYVGDKWPRGMEDVPWTDDREVMVSQYFARIRNEWYSIHLCPLEDNTHE